jgi:YVTN family beta-propeller protein
VHTAVSNTITTADEISPRPKVSASPEIAVQKPVTALAAEAALSPKANFVATQVISADDDELTESSGTVAAVALPAPVELDPLAPSGPLTPADSPLELALLAVGARSRSESIDGAQTFAAAAMVTVNSTPSVPAQPIGTPDPVTGVVTGTVIATDPENDPLTYTVAAGPTQGTVQLNSQTGAYTYTPTQAARVAAGATATADTDSFAVAVSDGQQTTTAPVSVYISPIRFEAQAPIAVGTNPSAAVIGVDGRMWVANTGSKTVSVINTVTGQRIDANSSSFSKDISVGSSPSALALSADGKRLYVANTGSGTVSVIDTATYKRIDTNPSAWGTQSISVGSSPNALAIGDDGRLYVANRGSNTVSVINTTTYKLVDVNPNVSGTQSISVGTAPSALAFSGGRLYVANRGSNTVSVIDTSSYSVTNTITVGSQPSAVTLGTDGRLYVANTGSNTVSVINTATNALAANAISVGPSPSSVTLSPNGSLAYVANTNDTVTVIDTATYKVVSTVAIDTDTTGGHVIAVNSNGTLYVTDAADKTVRVLKIAEGTGVSAIGSVTITGDRPGSLLLSADSTRAVLITAYPIGPVSPASYPDGIYGSTTRVAVIDTASGSQVGTTFTITGPHPAGVQLSADGTRVLITSSAYDATGTRVVVLNTATATQVGTTFTLTGGGSAQFIANDSRALITTAAYSQSTSTTTTRVAVLNTTTGTQAGATLLLAGSGSAALSPDGTHALFLTNAEVAAINAVTGTATTATLTGSWSLERWSANGSRAMISSRVTDAAGTITRVAVIDATTGAQTGTTLTITGYGSVQFDPAGTRALITTNVTSAGSTLTRIAVFNTTTGTQIGTILALAGDGSAGFGPDGTRVLITTDVYDSATTLHTTRVTTFNAATGTQTGTLTLTGNPYNRQPVFSPDGTRALITTAVYNPATTLHTSRVTMFDTATGTQTGTTLTLTGPDVAETTWRADSTRALITMTPTQYDSVISPMLVAVLDTTTGTQIGTTLSLVGKPTYGDQPVWTPDGTRALVTTKVYDSATGLNTTRVTTINTTTGTQIGATVSLTSGAFGGRVSLIPNGSHALITAGDQVTVINTNTGTQTGTTVTLNGPPSAPLFSADGSRALITSAGNLTVIDTTTATQVGTTLTLTPTGPRSIVTLLTADGTHALVTTDRRYIGDPAVPATPVAVIDLTTGNQIGTTLSLIGETYASPVFTFDGAHALITTGFDDLTTGVSTTRVTTVNIATGMQIGATVTLAGVLSSGVGNPSRVMLSPDGTRALVATTSLPDFRTSQVAMINTATGTQIGNTVTINGALSGLRWSTDGTRVFVTTYITTATGSDLSIRETVLETG